MAAEVIANSTATNRIYQKIMDRQGDVASQALRIDRALLFGPAYALDERPAAGRSTGELLCRRTGQTPTSRQLYQQADCERRGHQRSACKMAWLVSQCHLYSP
jgi:hypothetical protein